VSALLVALLALGTPATADSYRSSDPSDTRGRLDLKSVAVGHREDEQQGEWLIHRLRTFEPWRGRVLKRRATELDLRFDNDGDSGAERVIYVGFREGRLIAEMHEYDQSGDSADIFLIGEVPVMKPDRDRIKIFVPRAWLSEEQISRYRWRANSYFFDKDNPRCDDQHVCHDDVPDSGWLIHELD
jgi:hypothetical protein